MNEVENSPVMQKLWESYRRKFSYAADLEWSIIMGAVRSLYALCEKDRAYEKHGHYCKVCGEYKANENFSGKGMTINRLLNLPWRLSKEQISWLKNRMEDKRPEVRALAKEQYEMRFPPKQLEDTDDDFDFLDENDFIE